MRWEDTLISHHSFAGHLPRGLGHVVSIYCDARPWKILAGKAAGEEKGLAPWEQDASQLLAYNASDVKLTALAWQRMQPDLESERHVYESDKRMAKFCQDLTLSGIGIDMARQRELSKRLHERKKVLGDQLQALAGKNFNPQSLIDVRKALYRRLGQKVVLKTPTGLPKTNNEVLEHLRAKETRAGRFADLLLRYRACDKTLGSYIDNVDPIGKRLHAPWKLGPITGRLAGPLMTLPRYGDDYETHVKEMYVAQKHPRARFVAQIHDAAVIEVAGRFFYFDLSQAEARIAAYFSGDANLIAACESDIHLANAIVAFGEIPEVLERLKRGGEKSPSGVVFKKLPASEGGCKEERDVTKNVGFCVWYEGSAERAFVTLKSAGFPATMNACEELVNRFHARYVDYYRYVDRNEAAAKEQGYIRTVLLGRRAFTGHLVERTFIANYPIQSGIADVQNERLPLIEDRLRKCSTVADVKDLVAETFARPIKVPHNGLEFVLPAEFKEGGRWSDFG